MLDTVKPAAARPAGAPLFTPIATASLFAAKPATGANDLRLVALANAYEALQRQCDDHTAAHRYLKGAARVAAEDEFSLIGEGFHPLEEEMAETPADTMTGVLAKARLCQVDPARGTAGTEHLLSTIDDLHRLGGAAAAAAPAAPQESRAFRDIVGRWAATAEENARQFDLGERMDRILLLSGVPEALWERDGDKQLLNSIDHLSELGERRWYGHPDTIAALRQDATSASAGRKNRKARAIRVAEILAAFEAWQGRGTNAETLRESVACFCRSDDLAEQLDDLATDVLNAPVVSLDGLLIKALLSGDLYIDLWCALAAVEDRFNRPDKKDPPSYADHLQRDLLRVACARGMTRAPLAVGYVPEYRSVAESAA